MTTICYRSGEMAADTRAFAGRGAASPGRKTKIRRLSDGSLFGCTTTACGGADLIADWVEAGCPRPTSGDMIPDDFSAMLVRPNGEVFMAIDCLGLTGPLQAQFYAVGSGSEYALGAMYMGATAIGGVAAGIRFDPYTGGSITTLRLEPKS